MWYIASIVSASNRAREEKKRNKVYKEEPNKTKFLMSYQEGQCTVCGEPEGSELSICDNCRWF